MFPVSNKSARPNALPANNDTPAQPAKSGSATKNNRSNALHNANLRAPGSKVESDTCWSREYVDEATICFSETRTAIKHARITVEGAKTMRDAGESPTAKAKAAKDAATAAYATSSAALVRARAGNGSFKEAMESAAHTLHLCQEAKRAANVVVRHSEQSRQIADAANSVWQKALPLLSESCDYNQKLGLSDAATELVQDFVFSPDDKLKGAAARSSLPSPPPAASRSTRGTS